MFTVDEINTITEWILDLKPIIEHRMYVLISRKRFVGNRKHGSRTLPLKRADGTVEEVRIDDLFADPIKCMQALKDAGYCDVKDSNVDSAKFMKLILGMSRQMSSSFSESDVNTVREWILAGSPVPNTAPPTFEIKSNAAFAHKL